MIVFPFYHPRLQEGNWSWNPRRHICCARRRFAHSKPYHRALIGLRILTWKLCASMGNQHWALIHLVSCPAAVRLCALFSLSVSPGSHLPLSSLLLASAVADLPHFSSSYVTSMGSALLLFRKGNAFDARGCQPLRQMWEGDGNGGAGESGKMGRALVLEMTRWAQPQLA